MIHASFLKNNCVDTIALFLAPKIIGGQDALSWCGNLNIQNLEEILQTEIISITQLKEDALILLKIK